MKDRPNRKTRLTAVDLKRHQRFVHLHSWNKVLYLFDSECLGRLSRATSKLFVRHLVRTKSKTVKRLDSNKQGHYTKEGYFAIPLKISAVKGYYLATFHVRLLFVVMCKWFQGIQRFSEFVQLQPCVRKFVQFANIKTGRVLVQVGNHITDWRCWLEGCHNRNAIYS